MKLIRRFFGVFVPFVVLAANFSVFQYANAAVHSAGTNVVSNGTIFMVTDDGQRRPYTSAGAFLSYGFNSWATVQQATTEDMALPQGSFIPPRDGKIVCSDRGTDKGTCYLISNGMRAAFTSANIFTSLGFSFSKTLTGDVSFLAKDSDINNSSDQHRAGVLINKNGTIYLVSSGGLLGIPSIDVLGTWGYSFGDAVTANSSDTLLSQTSVINNRQGAALSPSVASTAPSSTNSNSPVTQGGVSEDSLLKGYIDTYPTLPTSTISDPQDAALILDLVKTINATPGTSFSVLYPYFTSETMDMINKVPSFVTYMNTPRAFLTNLNTINSNIKIFQGGNVALYSETDKQHLSGYDFGYISPTNWVFKKENGAWKWDYIGSLKYSESLYQQTNPTDAFVIGTGSTDLSVNAFITPDPMVNDPTTFIMVKIINVGQTTVEKFNFAVRFNTVVIDSGLRYYELKPGDFLQLAVPMNYYWSLTGVTKDPGQYNIEATVGFDNTVQDSNSKNNTADATAALSVNTTPVLH